MHQWFVIRLKRPALSFRIKVRVPLILLLLASLIFLTIVISISVGEYQVPFTDVLTTLFGEIDSRYTFIVVMRQRLPRTLVATLVGMSIAAAGAILQGLTRNPLASPDIIGISHGASVAAVSVIVLAQVTTITILPIFAFIGAAVSAFLVYILAWRDGVSPIRLLLMGICLSAISSAIVQIMIAKSDIIYVSQALVWLTGSVYGSTWVHFWALLPWILIFIPLALLLTRHLDALHLGDDLARGLGTRVEILRAILLATSVALAGSSVAIAGTVSFVGLMAPHIARTLVGSSHGGLIPTATLVGGFIVVLADLLGRILIPPYEIPCGVITAAVGAPYFVWILVRNRKL